MEIYGHRGAKDEAPENSLIGFEHLNNIDIFRVELDVRISADEVPVVIHDETLDRTTRGKGFVWDYTADQLTALQVPRLEDVFKRTPQMQHYQLEVKPDIPDRIAGLCNAMTDLIKRLDVQNKITITSLSTDVLAEFKRQAPHLSRGFVCERRVLFPVKKALQLDCTFLCLNYLRCHRQLVNRAHKKGLHVSVWTVNDVFVARELKAMGVDSLITDQPTKIRNFFETF